MCSNVVIAKVECVVWIHMTTQTHMKKLFISFSASVQAITIIIIHSLRIPGDVGGSPWYVVQPELSALPNVTF